MEFQRILALRGPNMWARFPVLEAWVDLQDLRDTASSEIPGFNERLKAALPTLIEHRCSEGVRGGFYQRLERGTYLAHILEHLALELQTLAGTEVGFGKSRMTSSEGVYKVAVRYRQEELGRASLESARQLVLACVHDRPFDVEAEVVKLKEIFAKHQPPALTGAILDAAREHSIPVRQLDAGGLLQLGYGSAQHRILNGLTDKASAVAGSIAYDWDLTRGLLQAVGVPTNYGHPVHSAEEAWSGAQYVELPVVIKPRYASGRGEVVGPLNTQEEVSAAYQRAKDEGWSPVVEHFSEGSSHLLLVMGEKVVGADNVHPDNVARLADALKVVGLDLASVEVVAKDLAKPLEEQGGAVVAIHGQPDLAAFLKQGAPVGTALIEHLFPGDKQGRIPVVSVTGTNGKTTTTRLTAHLVGQTHGPVGMCCTEGIYVGSRRTQTGDCSGPKSAKTVLQHREVNAAVLEVARGGILREGLGFDRCDVAIVTNIAEGDHLGSSDVDTPEQLAYVKSTIVWSVRDTGYAVLNANDPLTVGMAEYCKGKVVFFARDGKNPVIEEHRQKGGRVAFTRENQIIFAEGAQESVLISLSRVPLTHGGKVGFHVENSLASAAAAWCLGIPLEKIRAGLESFIPGLGNVPARFNLLDIHGLTVVLDYCHNTSALASFLETLEQLPHSFRTAMYSAAGDRRDSDIIRQGEMLGAAFDRVIIYEDTYLRGRKQGDITRLFRQGMEKVGRVKEILEVRGGTKGLEMAMSVSKPGDLLVIQPDLIDDGVAFLRKFLDEGGREVPLEEAIRRPKTAPVAVAAGAKIENANSGHAHHEEEPYDTLDADDVEVRKNDLGQGVYATRSFQKAEFILAGTGPLTAQRSMHSIQVDDRMHIIPSAPLRFLNHSCEPNCGLVVPRGSQDLEVHALRDIEEGEEMTLDYATFETEISALTGPCLCGAAGCRGRVIGYRGLSQEQRQAYGQYIAEHLREADIPIVIPAELELVGAPA